MKLKLTFVEGDSRNQLKVIGEEILEGDSEKPLTKSRALKMIKRFHSEFETSVIIKASEFPADWLVHWKQLGPNRWLYVYASRVEEESSPELLEEQD
ncbi:MAG TPA: hypothetical protein VFP71_13030 [Candidatus Angelobacter sp.]|nr:hypothetical protein [Candidatus Angelobacter sp.]